MDSYLTKKRFGQKKRALRVRRKIKAASNKPRLAVFRSNKHLAAQLIDDKSGRTICSVSTLSKEFKSTDFNRKNKTSAEALGKSLAEKAKQAGVSELSFDRGHLKYHGVIASFADAVRSGGIKF